MVICAFENFPSIPSFLATQIVYSDVRTIFTHDNHAILINLNEQEAMLTKQVATSKNESSDLNI
jgi:hypothetical protein